MSYNQTINIGDIFDLESHKTVVCMNLNDGHQFVGEVLEENKKGWPKGNNPHLIPEGYKPQATNTFWAFYPNSIIRKVPSPLQETYQIY